MILALDRVEDTLAAIRSALDQSGIARHVTVLDQGSQPAHLEQLAAAIADRADVSLLCAHTNLGVALGRNRASGFGHGRVIVALDNDAVFATTGTVAGLVAAFDRDPALAAVGCRIVRFDDGADDLSSWGYPPALLPLSAGSFPTATFVGAGHAIRRAAWDTAGGYDPALFFCWEEFDFCLRIIAMGWQIAYRGDLVVRHKVAAEHRVAWPERRWYQFVRNRLYIGRKYGDSWPRLLPRIALYAVKGAWNGLTWQTLKAIMAAVVMARMVRPRSLPITAVAYVDRCDGAYRGSWHQRLRREVLVSLDYPTTRPESAPAAKRHPA